MNLPQDFLPLFEAMYTSVQSKIVNEYNEGRITDNNYAGVLASALRDIVNASVSATLSAVDVQIKLDNNVFQKEMLQSQANMLAVDELNKSTMVALDITSKQKQQAQIQADIDFNVSKKTVMEWTRKDNVRMQAAREFAELLKYISAAGAVPAETDFANIRTLINGINQGVMVEDFQATITNPASGSSWVKVV
jgi:hypothetical protein